MVLARWSAIKDVHARAYAARFIFGGICTALAGLIANRWGPGVGGLFLAFPAIFPASASLIESHQKEHKREIGLDGTGRGRDAAALDAKGASLSAIALASFAAIVWLLVPRYNSVVGIALATVVWASVSPVLWLLWKRRPRKRGVSSARLRGRGRAVPS
jgi:hypothetical protein